MFSVTEGWKNAFPGAAGGILAMSNVTNPSRSVPLEEAKRELEEELRSRFAGADRAALRDLEPIRAYSEHYRKHRKTYHVQLQLESVALKGRPLPRVAALVEAMFMAEIKNMLLTAGHDLDVVRGPITLDVSTGEERYALMSGQEQDARPGDMMMSDGEGVISTVIYGPDRRTRIAAGTRRVAFLIYAAPGIGEEAVRRHLQDIHGHVALFAPDAQVDLLAVHGTD